MASPACARSPGLGNALRAACDGLIAKLEDRGARAVAGDARAAGSSSSEHQQAVEVARGHAAASRGIPSAAQRRAEGDGPADRSSRRQRRDAPEAAPRDERAPADGDDGPPATSTEAPRSGAGGSRRRPTRSSIRCRRRRRTLPGIGPAFAERLAEKGLETVEDLLWCLPRRYDDVRDAQPLAEVVRAATRASARRSSRRSRARAWCSRAAGGGPRSGSARSTSRSRRVATRRGRARSCAGSTCGPASTSGCRPARRSTLSGVVRKRGGRLELANPDILAIDVARAAAARREWAHARRSRCRRSSRAIPTSRACRRAGCARRVRPRVRASARAPTTACRRAIEQAAELPALGETLARLHSPPPDISRRGARGAQPRRQRVAAAARVRRAVRARRRGRAAAARAARGCGGAVPARRAGSTTTLAQALPFAPTSAQARVDRRDRATTSRAPVADEPAAPGRRRRGQDRGRVRGGAAGRARGRQTAVMAPTELLAEQHAETWKRVGARRRSCASSCSPRRRRRRVRASLLALLARGPDRRRDRHARAARRGRRVRRARARRDRRAASVRRRAAREAARQGRRAGRAAPARDDRDADPAHARADRVRRSRCLACSTSCRPGRTAGRDEACSPARAARPRRTS